MIQKIVPLLFASGDPISINELAEVLSCDKKDIELKIDELRDYLKKGGLELIYVDNEVSIVGGKESAKSIETLLKKDLEGELTPATLQVLTIVAYLGKVSKHDISFIRGVQSSQSIRTLSVRGLIKREGDDCSLTMDALRFLGVTKNEELPEYEALSKELSDKLREAKEA